MPYKMFKKDGKFCVKNEDTGESKGCSDSHAAAVGHMRALYAAEGGAKMGKKELDTLILKAIEDFNLENPDDLISKELVNKGYAPMGIYSFSSLAEYRAAQDLMEETYDLTGDFNSMVWNIMYAPDVEDKAAAVKSLADEFSSLLDEELSSSSDSEKARSDVTPADKKRAVAEYGNVRYADPANKKYPIDTEEHIRAAWSYIGMPKNQAKYKSGQVASIKRKIISAWKSKIDKAGPPKASKKELILSSLDDFANGIAEFFGSPEDEEEIFEETKEADDSGVMIWKEADTGQYRWLGRFSNNFRDEDRPPEIISEASHKYFVDRVEKGLAPMPTLRIWHIPEWTIGQADWLAYDDAGNEAGFTLASGTFTKGLDDVAEWLMGQNNVLMSHGMPPWSIRRDESDPTIIVQHESKEVSVLPDFAAANKLTGFAVLAMEEDMAIPKDKRDILEKQWKADPAMLDRLEAMNAKTAEAAKEAGLESKEQEATKDETTEVATETAKTEEVVTETPAPVETPQSEYPTRQEIVEAVSAILVPMAERLETLETALDGFTKALKEVQKDQDEQVKQVIENTPAASLGALLMQRVVGNPDAEVDGRKSLAKSKPQETPANDRSIGIPFLDSMISGNGK